MTLVVQSILFLILSTAVAVVQSESEVPHQQHQTRHRLLRQQRQQSDAKNATLPNDVPSSVPENPNALPHQYIVIFDETKVTNATATALDLLQTYSDTIGGSNEIEPPTTTGDDESDNDFDDDDEYYADQPVQIVWHYTTPYLQGVTLQGIRKNKNMELIAYLQNDPLVKYVEQDTQVTLDAVETAYWQKNPPNWGLDRIDHRSQQQETSDGSSSSTPEHFNRMYQFDQTGYGVVVFVIDTGIRFRHDEFTDEQRHPSNVECGYDAFHLHHHDDALLSGCHDGVGHGTYVAGIIGGHIYGVAKTTQMVSVKVFTDDGQGSIGSVLAGLDFVLRTKHLNSEAPIVANLSWGAGLIPTATGQKHSHAMIALLNGLVEQGVVLVASAGNEAANACDKVPAVHDFVITVAATNIDDQVTSYSNLGACVDIMAPGHAITSAWLNTNHDRVTLSGTSGAAAHVSGVVALLLERYPNASPEAIRGMLQKLAESNAVYGIPQEYANDTVNLLLNMGSLALV